MPSPLLSVRSLRKYFPGARALDGVDLDFLLGQVHGLIGENGAGKSTLVKILAGIYQPSDGQILFNDNPITLPHPVDAQNRGIVLIHQELNLVDELTVADNIFLGREPTRLGLVNRRAMADQASQILRAVESNLSPNVKVKSLSIAQKQMVEIAKALSYKASIVILDEPTAVLSRRETSALFAVIERLKRSGVAVVFISHILPEILKICDVVTVLRDGRTVASLDRLRLATSRESDLAGLMVGRPMQDHFPQRLPASSEKILEIKNLSVTRRVHDASFDLHRGEILGFAGLIGSGRSELAQAIVGLRKKSSGQILLYGQPLNIRNPRDAVRSGIAYLPEDRKDAGLTLGMSVSQNITMVSLKRYSRLLLRLRAESRAASSRIDQLNIKPPNPHRPVDLLSGGNQQKVALAKWLEISPKILIVDEPTRGVDIGAKEQIYSLLQRLTQQGISLILISSELNEVLGMSHRIAVMRSGRIAQIVDASGATEDSLMRLAAGVQHSSLHDILTP